MTTDSNDRRSTSSEVSRRAPPVQECPRCGTLVVAIAGSKLAVCRNCGYKEPCC